MVVQVRQAIVIATTNDSTQLVGAKLLSRVLMTFFGVVQQLQSLQATNSTTTHVVRPYSDPICGRLHQ